jgi:galactose oxidase-like protein
MIQSIKRLFIHAAILALLLPGCGPEGPQLAFQFTIARQPLDSPLGGPSPERGQPPPGIDAFRICIQDASGKKLVCDDFLDLTIPTVRVEGIPAGSDRVVTFQGYSIDPASRERDVIWCGRATGINIHDKGVTPVSMLLTLCGDFTETPAPLGEGRVFHTATRLTNGKIAIVGGYVSMQPGVGCSRTCTALTASSSVEIYDPDLGTFTQAMDLTHARGLHVARALSDGRLLVAGGCQTASLQSSFADADNPGSPLRCLEPGPAATSAEIIDPATANGQSFDIPSSIFASALELGSEQLVLIGGLDSTGNSQDSALMLHAIGLSLTTTEIPSVLDAKRRSATSVAISIPGSDPAEGLILGGMPATNLNDPGLFAERLIAGQGEVFTSVPRFVETSIGTGLPVMHASGARVSPGRLLFSGGVFPGRFLDQDMPFLPKPLTNSAIIDMRTESFQLLPAESQLGIPRVFHSTTVVDSAGHALVAGGFFKLDPTASTHHQASASTEAWDEGMESFTLVWLRGEPVNMIYARAGHTATQLPNGTILFVGGLDDSSIQNTAEIFSPFSAELGTEGLSSL